MNIYILVEGKETERKVYPEWIKILIPKINKINNIDNFQDNNFFIIAGKGYKRLFSMLDSVVDDINQIKTIDYLLICIDSDGKNIVDVEAEIETFMKENDIILNSNTSIVYIVQNICIETWFLGNRNIVTRNPHSKDLSEMLKFYNVAVSDPENMGKPIDFTDSIASFHEKYLKLIFSEKNLSYSKQRPNEVTKEYYLKELIERAMETGDILSFKKFFDFCCRVSESNY